MFTNFPLLVQMLVWGFKPRIVVTDAGVWYPVLLRLSIKISVIKGGAPILNVLMPPLRVIIGFILFSTVLAQSVPSMALLIFLVSLLSLCSILISFVLIRAWDILPLVPFYLGGGIKTRHYPWRKKYCTV